jgi:hypothetical protein
MATGTLPTPRPHPGPFIRLIRLLSLLLMLAPLAVGGASAAGFAGLRAMPAYRSVPTATLFAAFKNVGIAEIGESPHLAARQPTGSVPICAGVANASIKPLRSAFGLMRGTAEGRRLYAVLVDNGVCVTVADLPFNAAYAESRRTFPNDWSGSRIVVDRRLVRITDIDVLAAVLVHESTHIDRAVTGKACFLTNTCTVLANGVEVEEEVAAHTAEAQWWIAAYGKNGKRFAYRDDYGENRLASAYEKGPAAFRAYVAKFRADPREGEGING